MIPNSDLTGAQNHYSLTHHIQGNTPLENAEIVCVADVPSDIEMQDKNAILVDQIWRDHLVLIENLPLGQVRNVKSIFRNIKSVYGWDLPNADTMVQECEAKEYILKNLLPIVDDAFKHEQWRDLIKSNPLWIKFLKLIPAQRAKAKQGVETLLKCGYYRQSFGKALETLLLAVEQDMRSEMSMLYKNSFQARLATLQRAIMEGLALNQKMIVCLSANFVFRSHDLSGSQFDNSDFLAYLQSRKYVIIHAKNSRHKIEGQPTLWSTAFDRMFPTSSSTDNADTSRFSAAKKAEGTETSGVQSAIPYIWERPENQNLTSIKFKPQNHSSPNDFPREIVRV